MFDGTLLMAILIAMVTCTAALGYARGYLKETLSSSPVRNLLRLQLLYYVESLILLTCALIWGILLTLAVMQYCSMEADSYSMVSDDQDDPRFTLYSILASLVVGALLYKLLYRRATTIVQRQWDQRIHPMASR